jgi:hypothetical protein
MSKTATGASVTTRVIIVLAILLIGAVLIELSPRLFGIVVVREPIAPARALKSIPRTLGQLPDLYVADSVDEILPKEVRAQLGTDEYLLRNYTNSRLQAREPGARLAVNINYYGQGDRSSPHVPDICWAGQGLERVADDPMLVNDVELADGSKVDVPMRILQFKSGSTGEVMPGGRRESDKPIVVAYTFLVNGDFVDHRNKVTGKIWRSGRFAYHTKIEVTMMEPTTRDDAKPVLDAFVRKLIKEVVLCMPTTAALKS